MQWRGLNEAMKKTCQQAGGNKKRAHVRSEQYGKIIQFRFFRAILWFSMQFAFCCIILGTASLLQSGWTAQGHGVPLVQYFYQGHKSLFTVLRGIMSFPINFGWVISRWRFDLRLNIADSHKCPSVSFFTHYHSLPLQVSRDACGDSCFCLSDCLDL